MADPEYVLRYKFVAMAKLHNFFGGMDSYMKEFARIVQSTGDATMIRNLQRVLNTEIAIKNETANKDILNKYKDLPQ